MAQEMGSSAELVLPGSTGQYQNEQPQALLHSLALGKHKEEVSTIAT